MFTLRQIGIIAYLIGKGDFVSGEQLSARFAFGKKTLQAEIRDLEDQLGDDCRIISGSKGYKLEYLTETARNRLYAQLDAYGGWSNMGIRPSAIALYLLFQESFVSMQQLADEFFLSKTAIALEIPTVKRWLERYHALTLEVSPQRGIRIGGNEHHKRIYCAKFGNLVAFQCAPFPAEIWKDYISYLNAAGQVLQTLLPESGYLLTGEGYREISRFIAVSILRSRMGYILEENCRIPEQESFLQLLSCSIEQETQYRLQPSELEDIAALMEESCTLLPPTDDDTELEQRLFQMEQRLGEITGLEDRRFFPEHNLVLQHLKKMTHRMQARDVAVNQDNEDILRRFPLEVHLMYRLIPEYFGGYVSKETSSMALFLACGLQQRHTLTVLLVSDRNQSIISHIKTTLEQRSDGYEIEITVFPRYLFENQPEMRSHYDLLLTTDQETLLRYPDFFLTPCVFFPKDVESISRLLQKVVMQKQDSLHRNILERYLHHETVSNNGTEFLTDIINCPHDGFQSYHPFGNKNIYIGRVAPGETPLITVYHLKKPVNFHYKKISKIIFVRHPEGDPNMLSFFDAVMEILQEM